MSLRPRATTSPAAFAHRGFSIQSARIASRRLASIAGRLVSVR